MIAVLGSPTALSAVGQPKTAIMSAATNHTHPSGTTPNNDHELNPRRD
jgi:hypothetical protein